MKPAKKSPSRRRKQNKGLSRQQMLFLALSLLAGLSMVVAIIVGSLPAPTPPQETLTPAVVSPTPIVTPTFTVVPTPERATPGPAIAPTPQ